MFENHRWPVYGTEPHALYSHACVDACTIYVVYPDGINRWEIDFEFWWQIFISLDGSLDGGKRSFWVTFIKDDPTFFNKFENRCITLLRSLSIWNKYFHGDNRFDMIKASSCQPSVMHSCINCELITFKNFSTMMGKYPQFRGIHRQVIHLTSFNVKWITCNPTRFKLSHGPSRIRLKTAL